MTENPQGTAIDEVDLRCLSRAELAQAFVDSLHGRRDKRAVLNEFRRRYWEDVMADAEAGHSISCEELHRRPLRVYAQHLESCGVQVLAEENRAS